MTLQDALIQSGGLTQEAEKNRVEVSRIMDYDITSNRLKPKRTLIKTINIEQDLEFSKEAAEFTLQPYDQIFVRSNPNFEPVKNIIIFGEVKYPGVYSILRKDEKVSSLVSRAGGLTKYAYMDGVKMFRKFKVQIDNNENESFSSELLDSIKNYPSLSSLYTQNLLNKSLESNINKDFEYVYDAVYLNMKKALNSKTSKHNLVLLEGDSIFVPKTLDLVHITGDLMNLEGNSISAPHFNRRRAHYYVNNFAGGYTKENKKSNTVVIYPNGIARKTLNFGLFTISPKVKKGSTIKVFSKENKIKQKKESKVDWNRQIENAMLKISAVLTLWVLVDRVNSQ